jgi:hypothetical protein
MKESSISNKAFETCSVKLHCVPVGAEGSRNSQSTGIGTFQFLRMI